MSVRSDRTKDATNDAVAALGEQAADVALAEGSGYTVASPDKPLKRQLVVSIRASLDDLCRSRSKSVWSPSSEALKSIFQQRKFTSLAGAAEAQGDLKSVVLHDLSVTGVSSTFPVALGARITGVDDQTFSSTGEAYSMIVLPEMSSANERVLQQDDVSLAYSFAQKFPGYTADNLAEKGIHEVSQRRFVLVSADHPTLVQTQVSSQIRVRDMSRATVSVEPAEFSSWEDARASIMTEKKRALKARLEHEIGSAVDEADAKAIRERFLKEENNIERDVDHAPFSVHLSLSAAYNFLAR